MAEGTEIIGREPTRAPQFRRALSAAHGPWFRRAARRSKSGCVIALFFPCPGVKFGPNNASAASPADSGQVVALSMH